MTKEYLENILTEYGVAFTDSLADRLLKEFKSCEDAISRECAINAVSEALEHVLVENEDVARKMMNKLPAVNPQPKTGHWKAKSFHELFCDNCGFDFDIMRNDFIDKMNYCPNCGKKMDERREVRDKV